MGGREGMEWEGGGKNHNNIIVMLSNTRVI